MTETKKYRRRVTNVQVKRAIEAMHALWDYKGMCSALPAGFPSFHELARAVLETAADVVDAWQIERWKTAYRYQEGAWGIAAIPTIDFNAEWEEVPND